MVLTMAQISKWARINVRQARLIIFACYTLLYGLTYCCGQVLQVSGTILPKLGIFAGFCIGISVYIAHELLHRRMLMPQRFVFQKVCCMVILSASFCGLVVLFAQPAGTFPLQQNKAHAAFPIKKTPAKVSVLPPLFTEIKSAKEMSRVQGLESVINYIGYYCSRCIRTCDCHTILCYSVCRQWLARYRRFLCRQYRRCFSYCFSYTKNFR